jgi:hypothetical protein
VDEAPPSLNYSVLLLILSCLCNIHLQLLFLASALVLLRWYARCHKYVVLELLIFAASCICIIYLDVNWFCGFFFRFFSSYMLLGWLMDLAVHVGSGCCLCRRWVLFMEERRKGFFFFFFAILGVGLLVVLEWRMERIVSLGAWWGGRWLVSGLRVCEGVEWWKVCTAGCLIPAERLNSHLVVISLFSTLGLLVCMFCVGCLLILIASAAIFAYGDAAFLRLRCID